MGLLTWLGILKPKQEVTDREFMALLEQQILAGEPSVDPVLKDVRTVETAVRDFVAEQLFIDGNPQAGYRGPNIGFWSNRYR